MHLPTTVRTLGAAWLLAPVLALLATLAFAHPARAEATDFVVTNCTNDSALRTAAEAAGTHTITFNCGTATVPVGAFFSVQGNITIDGGGRIALDGGDMAAFFQVYGSAELTLRNITLQNGAPAGAHPLDNFGILTLDRVVVRDSRSAGAGGVALNAGTLTVRNSTFLNNSGAVVPPVNFFGVAIHHIGDALTVTNSTFSGNTVTDALSFGGAIYNGGQNTVIEGTTFRNNQAAQGGALINYVGRIAQIANSHFDGNSAELGGAIVNYGELEIEASRFSGNKASVSAGGAIYTTLAAGRLTLLRTTFAANTANARGGAIYCEGGSLSIVGSTLSGNRALGDDGGAVASRCGAEVVNSTLSGNQAGGFGGGFYQEVSNTAALRFVTLAHNRAVAGAGVYNDGSGTSVVQLSRTLLAGNRLTGGALANCDGASINSLNYNVEDGNNCSALSLSGDQRNAALPLTPLGGYGGPTATHLPLPGSAAVNRIPAAQCADAQDQRGVARPQAAACDSGAVEFNHFRIFLPAVDR